jgi:hypothetical protein
MKIFWYLNRLKRMSACEILYRFTTFLIERYEKIRFTGFFPSPMTVPPTAKVLPDMDYAWSGQKETLRIFDQELDYSDAVDWHFDLKTKNRFPLIHSNRIDIRTPKYGSAKHVWEVNRMQFLPQICLNFKTTGDDRYLSKLMFNIDSWISANPYLLGVNWYSNIEVNIRLINWFLCWEIVDGFELMRSNISFKEFATKKWIPLIYLHCKHSRGHLSEYSSANNHLIAELAGLFIASSVWKFRQSERWSSYAKKRLEIEIVKQHTKNGINREEAAEYIQFITDFFLVSYIVAKNTNNKFSKVYDQTLKKIFEYIYNFTDVKGNHPRYGDEDDGQVFRLTPHLENNFVSLLNTGSFLFGEPKYRSKVENVDLKSQLLLGSNATGRLGILSAENSQPYSSFYTEDGHFIFKNKNGDKEVYMHFDAAPLGYLSIAAHGHADALSFVLHINGRDVFADPGTYSYHTDPEWRKYFISTLAHNTVCINGENQAVFGGSTLWVTRFHTQILEIFHDDLWDRVYASHDGYKSLGIRHSRKIELNRKTNDILITDFLDTSAASEYRVEIPFHLSPYFTVTKERENSFIIKNGTTKVRLQCDPQLISEPVTGSDNPKLGWYSESFQIIQPTSVIYCHTSVKFSARFAFKISIINV